MASAKRPRLDFAAAIALREKLNREAAQQQPPPPPPPPPSSSPPPPPPPSASTDAALLAKLGVTMTSSASLERRVVSSAEDSLHAAEMARFAEQQQQLQGRIADVSRRLDAHQLTADGRRALEDRLEALNDEMDLLATVRERALLRHAKEAAARAREAAADVGGVGEEGSSSLVEEEEDAHERQLRLGLITPTAATTFVRPPATVAPRAAGGASKEYMAGTALGAKTRVVKGGRTHGATSEWESERVARRVQAQARAKKDVDQRRRRVVVARDADFVDDGERDRYDARLDELEDEDEEDVVEFDGGLLLRASVYDSLFTYQRTGVKWLWELHMQGAGGIIGDEMGLGKTVQVAAFLDALRRTSVAHCSLIVVPATVMSQWVREFHRWAPRMRVVLLHASGTVHGGSGGVARMLRRWRKETPSLVVVTTYATVRTQSQHLLPFPFDYVILDEGHKIRNPNAEITLVCKQFRTSHRLILSGSPVQNNLSELWSLFDFVFPGKLGTLPVFETEFGVPITMGGYVNASVHAVQAAYKCAVLLRDIISPFLMRRMKKDVHVQMTNKDEQILFTRLTPLQREIYVRYLESPEVVDVLHGNVRSFHAIQVLRKICNHPDLLKKDDKDEDADEDEGKDAFGAPEKSGKLQVVRDLLPVWKQQGHRVLLFSQTRMMLDILETMLTRLGYQYLRMDGTTNIKSRMTLIDQFNNDEENFVFLLTTRVGGLGVNLTGANRVLIFDPDWNPSTDAQARERAWRIGQKRDVSVYRLVTSGTIEEKIYHRQIFKHFLTDKVLKDPKQQRFFKNKDLKDLFTLGDDTGGSTETGDIFAQVAEKPKAEAGEGEDKGEGGDGGGEDGQDKQDGASPEVGHDENYLIARLLAKDGVHSAMSHDAIVGGELRERSLVETEAEKVAQRAARNVMRSRRALRAQPVHVPTDTGASRFGVRAGARPSPAPRRPAIVNSMRESATPRKRHRDEDEATTTTTTTATTSTSSSVLLARLRQRAQQGTEEEEEEEDPVAASTIAAAQPPPDAETDAAQERTQQLIDFLLARPGHAAPTEAIVSNFRWTVTKEESATFRALLKRVARFEKGQPGTWTLREAYAT